jgi:hypothetical protein
VSGKREKAAKKYARVSLFCLLTEFLDSFIAFLGASQYPGTRVRGVQKHYTKTAVIVFLAVSLHEEFKQN